MIIINKCFFSNTRSNYQKVPFSKGPIFKSSNLQKVQLSKDPIFKRSNFQKVQLSKGPIFQLDLLKIGPFVATPKE